MLKLERFFKKYGSVAEWFKALACPITKRRVGRMANALVLKTSG